MSSRSIELTDNIYTYLLENSLRENLHCTNLRAETALLEMSRMQISPEQGQFMALLVEIIGAKKAIEVGVFTGYSSLCVALAMPDDAHIVACDINLEWTSIAQKYWKRAGVSHKIDLRLAPALDTLQQLIDSGASGSFDIAFVDADKGNYVQYYELCLTLLRSGGILMVDNVLWGGDVANSDITDTDTEAIRELNRKIHQDPRISLSMLPLGDGLTVVRKR